MYAIVIILIDQYIAILQYYARACYNTYQYSSTTYVHDILAAIVHVHVCILELVVPGYVFNTCCTSE